VYTRKVVRKQEEKEGWISKMMSYQEYTHSLCISCYAIHSTMRDEAAHKKRSQEEETQTFKCV
jgi:hypothetical protein